MSELRKQALPDELLLMVQKPARYLGNEMNAVFKGAERDFRKKKSERSSVRFAMCFPDVYEIGMSHLGIQILYELFNRRKDTWCERVFSPWTDMEKLLREKKIPLFALESQEPVRNFDFLGFTLQFELCYTSVLQVLDLSGIPLNAADRTEDDPIVIGGGPCACNPEPMARFFDLFYIGEGETSYDALLDLYRRMKKGEDVPGPDMHPAFSDEAGYDGKTFHRGSADEAGYDGKTFHRASSDESGWDRQAFLRVAAQIPGIYVPSLYEVSYAKDGTIESFRPKNHCHCEPGSQDGVRDGSAISFDAEKKQAAADPGGYEDAAAPEDPPIPARVRRQVAADLDDSKKVPYPEKPLIPFLTVTQDRVAVELQRGCIRGCRFCQAGMIYRPNRERSLDTVKRFADEMLCSTGQDDILLSSLSSSDYSCIREIVDHVSSRYEADRVKLQVPSLRIDSFSLDLMAKVQDVRRSSLTFAPEAGSQRLRDVINKGLTEEDILAGSREAFRGGWNKVKLYFMLGLPTETEEDRAAISDLANKISAAYYEEVPKEKRNGRCQITVSTSFFVPKPFTPFQWARMYRPGDYLGFAATVNHAIYQARNHRSILYSWHEADGSYLEGVLARGDRRVADLILEAYRLGARFDCWIETWDYARWEQAAANTGVDMDFYTLRERKEDEIFPWDFIDIGVRRSFLWKEWEKARTAVTTPNCRQACSACGAADYGCGICKKARTPEKAYTPEKIRTTEKARTSEKSCTTEKVRTTEKARTTEKVRTSEKSLTPEKDTERTAELAETGFSPKEKIVQESSFDTAKNGKILQENSFDPPQRDNSTQKIYGGTSDTGQDENNQPGAEPLCYKVRLRLSKYGPMKFIGHLELMRFLQKCIRRTDIDIRYSDGITPRMIMSTAMPLGLGLESDGEYIDLELGSPVTTQHALSQLRPLMPEGLDILDIRQLGDPVPAGGGGEGKKKPQKAMAAVAAALYEVRFRDSFLRDGTLPADWRQILEDFAGQEEIPWTKETKKGFRTLDMKELIYHFSIEDKMMDDSAAEENTVLEKDTVCEQDSTQEEDTAGKQDSAHGYPTSPLIRMCVCSRVGENLRPEQLIGEALKRSGYELPEDALQIRRIDLYAERPDGGSGKPAELSEKTGRYGVPERFISLGEIGKTV